MISSSNYLSSLTPTELHNCVTLHRQYVALMSADGNAQQTHVNKKKKQEILINITKFYINDHNLNNHYQHYMIIVKTKVNIVTKPHP